MIGKEHINMSTASKTRKYYDIFTTVQHRDYISLFLLGEFIGKFDNWREVEEEKHIITGY